MVVQPGRLWVGGALTMSLQCLMKEVSTASTFLLLRGTGSLSRHGGSYVDLSDRNRPAGYGVTRGGRNQT